MTIGGGGGGGFGEGCAVCPDASARPSCGKSGGFEGREGCRSAASRSGTSSAGSRGPLLLAALHRTNATPQKPRRAAVVGRAFKYVSIRSKSSIAYASEAGQPAPRIQALRANRGVVYDILSRTIFWFWLSKVMLKRSKKSTLPSKNGTVSDLVIRQATSNSSCSIRRWRLLL